MAALQKPPAAMPTRRSRIEPLTTATMASALPTTAMLIPSTIPARRPRRAMTDERRVAASAVPATAVALGEPQFRLLLIGQAASAFGDALIPVAIAFAVLSIGGSAIELGYVFAAFPASPLVLGLAGGGWADRLPRQLVMVGCDVVRTVAEVVLAVLLLTGTAEVWHLVLVVTVVGGAGGFFAPASSGLVPQVISPGRLQEANALMGLSRNATGIFGPPIAGLLVVGFGTGIVFLVDAATFAVSAVSLLMLRVPARGAPPAGHPRFLADLAEGWREVTSRPWLLAAISTFAVTNMAAAPIFILGPGVADTPLGGAG